MLEAQGYLYEGVQRLSFGLPSPNYAGAVIAMVLPAFWGGLAYADTRFHRGWLLLLSTSEYAVFLALCMTFSRGALAATVLCLVHHLALRWFVARPVWDKEKWTWIVRPAVYALLVVTSGVGARTGDAFSGSDASVLNRFEYWNAGLLALKNLPLFGIPGAQAHAYFVNWYSGIDSSRTVGGFVNSYLDWGIQWGAISLGWLIFLVFWSAAYPLFLKASVPEGKRICVCSLSSPMVAFGIAGLFSSLLGLLAFNVCLLVLFCVNFGLWLKFCQKKGLFLAGSVGFTALFVFAVLHLPIKNRGGFVVKITNEGVISLLRENIPRETARHDLALVCDAEVMEGPYGKEARRLMSKWSEIGSALVFPPDYEKKLQVEASRIIVFGCKWKSILSLNAFAMKITLFHPMGLPDKMIEETPVSLIVLPKIDEEGSVSEWLEFATKRGIPVVWTDGGQCLLENWTQAFEPTLLEKGRQ